MTRASQISLRALNYHNAATEDILTGGKGQQNVSNNPFLINFAAESAFPRPAALHIYRSR